MARPLAVVQGDLQHARRLVDVYANQRSEADRMHRAALRRIEELKDEVIAALDQDQAPHDNFPPPGVGTVTHPDRGIATPHAPTPTNNTPARPKRVRKPAPTLPPPPAPGVAG